MKIILSFISVILITSYMAFGQNNELESHNELNSIYLGLKVDNLFVNHFNAYFQNRDAYCNPEITRASAAGDGYNFGISFSYMLTKNNPSLTSIVVNANYQNTSAYSWIKADDFPTLVPNDSFPSGIKIEETSTHWFADINLSYFTLDILYNQLLSDKFPLGLSIGPYCSILLDNNFYQSYNLDGKHEFSYDSKYKNNNKTIIFYDREIEDIQRFAFGIKSQIIYVIQLHNNLQLVPKIGYSIPLTNVIYNKKWRLYSYNFGLTVNYKLR